MAQYDYLDYMNIAQLKSLHKHNSATLKQMRERTLPRQAMDIQKFADEQHEYAIQEQQNFLDELAKRISKLESFLK